MKENEKYEYNNNISNNDIRLSNLTIDLDEYNENRENKELENHEEIKKIEKIVCPVCGKIPSIEIDYKNYRIKSYCPERHDKNEKMIKYIKESNDKIEELQESIKCSSCGKTNTELKIDKDDMYLCNCSKDFCEDCKEKHEEEDDEIPHSLIKYSEIDFKCKCSGEYADYYCYCVNCNKNFCQACLNEHNAENQGHEIIYFSDEIEKFLTEKDIKEKKEKLSETEDEIKEFLNNLDDWKKIFDLKIKLLKENLNLLIQVNKYLLNSFDKSNLNQQVIESTKKLNFDYDKLIEEFNGKTNNDKKERINIDNFEHQNGYLMGLLTYQKNIIITRKERAKKNKNIKDLNIIKNSPSIEAKIENKITAICQFDEGIIVGDDKGLVHLYKLDNNLTNTLTISDSSGKSINYLCSLKNKYFVSSNEIGIKIININNTKNKTLYNVIKTLNYNNENNNIMNNSAYLGTNLNISKNENLSRKTIGIKQSKNKEKEEKKYYQIIELINGNIVYICKDTLIILEPILNNNYKIKKLSDITNGNIISITEINDNNFCAYSENNEIITLDSNDFSKKGETITIQNENDIFKKLEAINDGMLVGLGQNKIYIISLYIKSENKIIKTINNNQFNNIDMKITMNPYKILIAGFRGNKNCINQYNFDLTKDGLITSSKNDTINSETRINMIFLYEDKNEKDAKLVYIHNNNFIKIYKNSNN